jgi:alpha-tubulin suppressor-like RCC1 family protein
MPNQFLSPEGDLENYFVSEYWLIDQWIGDELWNWGYNGYGNLGTNDTTQRNTPVNTLTGGNNWKQVAGGNSHTAAVKTDGTLWVWGRNNLAQLGTNNTTDTSTPVTTFAGGTNWKQVSSGGSHTAAVKTDGTLWVWGNNNNVQLGTNDATNRSTPVTTFAGGTNWKQVSSGGSHTAAVKTDGTLWTWGFNGNGQLGTNDASTRSTPVTTFAGGTNWKQVSAGELQTAAIKTDGTLWTWGSNFEGNLGTNDAFSRNTPVTTFAGGTNWKQVAGGNSHTAAVKTDGTLWTWGYSSYGCLGNNVAGSFFTPITTFAGGINWKQVDVGIQHTAAIKTDGTLWTWGYSYLGRLGNNESLYAVGILTPITIFGGGTNWKQVACGSNYTAAVTSGIPANLPLS